MQLLAVELPETLLVIILVIVALIAVGLTGAVFLLINLRSKLAVQRLKFLGFYAHDTALSTDYAEFVIGNKSLNEVGISEIGLKNGSVNFDLTKLYKDRAGLRREDRIVIEQRSAIRFRLSEKELAQVFIEGKRGKILGSLKIYCVDLTGTLYTSKLKGVKKLAQKVLVSVNEGKQLSAVIPEFSEAPAQAE